MSFADYEYGHCETKYADYGEDLSCLSSSNDFQTSIVQSVCGSGRDADCDGYYHSVNNTKLPLKLASDNNHISLADHLLPGQVHPQSGEAVLCRRLRVEVRGLRRDPQVLRQRRGRLWTMRLWTRRRLQRQRRLPRHPVLQDVQRKRSQQQNHIPIIISIILLYNCIVPWIVVIIQLPDRHKFTVSHFCRQ